MSVPRSRFGLLYIDAVPAHRKAFCCATNRMRSGLLHRRMSRDVELCLTNVLPLPQSILRPAPAPLLNPKSMLTDVGPVELWATRRRRPSAAANPQGFCWLPERLRGPPSVTLLPHIGGIKRMPTKSG